MALLGVYYVCGGDLMCVMVVMHTEMVNVFSRKKKIVDDGGGFGVFLHVFFSFLCISILDRQ